jgi:hypothetical protein
MGFLDQLRSRRRDPEPVEVELTVEAELTRRLSIVGESHYQTELESICKPIEGEDVRFECFAELIPEPDNEHDPNAIMVCIDGVCVGYLSRRNAARYNKGIVAMREAGQPTICKAFIGRLAQSENPNLGVALDVPLNHLES